MSTIEFDIKELVYCIHNNKIVRGIITKVTRSLEDNYVRSKYAIEYEIDSKREYAFYIENVYNTKEDLLKELSNTCQ